MEWERERENETQMSNDSLLELKGKKSDDLTIVIIELISDIIDEIDRLKEEKERKKKWCTNT